MKGKALFALAASMAALVLITRLHLHTRPNLSENVESTANDATRGPAPPTPVPPTVQTSNFAPASRVEAPKTVVEPDLLASGNKLQRLAQTRERFQTLAAGDPTVALQ